MFHRFAGPTRRLALALLALALVAVFACSPSISAPLALFAPPTPTADPFLMVRARSRAAFERGMTFFQNGDLERALYEFDQAKLNDPDNRPDIQEMLDRTVALLRLTPTAVPPTRRPTSTPDPNATPGLLFGGLATRATPTGGPVAPATPAPAPSATPVTPSEPEPEPSPTPVIPLETYRDPSGQFSLGIAPGWQPANPSGAEAGTPLVAFGDATGAATLTVSLDTLSTDVSPELYAARLETAMQSLPGYRSEGVRSVYIDNHPAVRRVFSVAGPSTTYRTVQVILVDRRSVYLLTGTSPATDFPAHALLLDRMIGSFKLGV